jgi:predicted metal-dependent peptidase
MQSEQNSTETPSALVSDDLTPAQVEAWNATLSAMIYKCPGFRHIWFKMLSTTHNRGKAEHRAVFTRSIPIAATDGKNLLLNPDTFFKFKLMERVFIAAHEVVHNVYEDVEHWHRFRMANKVPTASGKSLEWDEATGQKAGDLRINALLLRSRIGTKPHWPDQETIDRCGATNQASVGDVCGHFDDNMNGTESFLDVYEKEYKKRKHDPDGDQQGEGQGQPGANPGGFDGVQSPGSSTGQQAEQAAAERNPGQWKVEIAVAQQLERSCGNLSASMARMFKDILEPEVYWLDHMETMIRRHTGNDIYDWRNPDPWFIGRDIYLPSKTGHRAGWIVMWGDTSGSRSDQEIASHIAECKGIMEDCRPTRLTIVWGDARVTHVDEIADPADLERVQPKGGGGTSILPILQWIKEQDATPDLFIAFTDGALHFPQQPRDYPTIWASSTDAAYPWGEVVRVNKRVQ